MNVQLQEGRVLLDRFVLRRPLQDEGAVALWFARDVRLEAGRLLKIHRSAADAADDLRETLARDVRAYQGLDHAHVARVLELHETEGLLVVSMEPRDGELLAARARRDGPLPYRRLVDHVRPLAEGLLQLQERGVEHGRVAPDHVLVGDAGWILLPADPTRPARSDLTGLGHLMAAALTGDRAPEAGRSVNDVADRLHAGRTVPALLNQLVDDLRAEDTALRPTGLRDVLHRLDQLERFVTPDPVPAPAAGAGAEPAAGTATAARRRPLTVARGAWLLAPVGLVAGAVLLHAALPARTPRPADAPAPHAAAVSTPEPDAPDPAPTVDPEALAAARAKADAALDALLAVRRDAEAIGAAAWGGEAYAGAAAAAETGDRAFLEERYDEAARGYGEAADGFRRLVDTQAQTLADLLEEGRAALDAPDAERAATAFRHALLIDPDHAEAATGLRRAGTLDELHGLLAAGREHEAAGRLEFAHADYARAAQLDPLSPEAAAAYDDIKQRLADAEFRAIMSRALDAYHRAEFEAARAALLEAERFRPGAAEIAETLAMVEEGQRRHAIDRLRREAGTHETREAWQAAWNVYRQVLAIDPAILFAQEGKSRCEEMIRLDRDTQRFLASPGLLTRRGTREDAVLLVRELERHADLGPRMQADRARLAELVRLANTPLRVELRSDGETEVSVHHVGRLGTLRSRAIEVLPGIYTVVGRRKGYRDVRLTLEVKPGEPGPPLEVVCTERIDG
ncbi:MAG: serine/threonine-protein kinase [Planctomycetota bacterium]